MTTVRESATQLRDKIITQAEKPTRCEAKEASIPEEIRAIRRWICWKWFRKAGSDRWTKKPLRIDGTPASFTNSADWSRFDECIQGYQTLPDIDGIGFVLGQGYYGFDIDCCLFEGRIDRKVDEFLAANPSYTEISPTGTGLKTIFKGDPPQGWTDKQIDLYQNKFFTITGNLWDTYSCEINDFLSEVESSVEQAIEAMKRIPVGDEQDGSGRLIKYANRAARFGLDIADAIAAIREVLAEQPTPKEFSDDEIERRIEDAQAKLKKLEKKVSVAPMNFTELVQRNPKLKEPLIEGLLRIGETMNIVASPKIGKSFLASNLAWAVASGTAWLGMTTKQGKVAIIDNELHPETLAYRLQEVAQGMFLDEEVLSNIDVLPLRGHSIDINQLVTLGIEPGKYSLIVVDALYRFLPKGSSENDNADMMAIYNALDSCAARWGCAIAVVHHSSKGFQGDKSVTDVGSGAGSISRAADTHAIIRPHSEEDLAVLEVVTRSFRSPEAMSLKFSYPIWSAVGVAPKLRSADQRTGKKAEDDESLAALLELIPEGKAVRRARLAEQMGMGVNKFNRLIELALNRRLIRKKSRVPKGQKRVQLYFQKIG
jgi:hypothetical protein